MSRGEHTEAQIIEALKQMEAGRKLEGTPAIQESRKVRCMAGMRSTAACVSEAQEIKQLGDENSRLNAGSAELSLDKEALQSVFRKNSLSS